MFLTRQQRYDLADSKEVEVTGVSVPVWYYQGKTSEPGNEVFVKYKLRPTEYKVFVKHNEEGYEIYLPHKSFNPEDNRTNPFTLKNLLDHKDGGIEWIAFRQFGKAKKNKRTVDIIHFVEIKTIEELMANLS
jgi:hypothetical protein